MSIYLVIAEHECCCGTGGHDGPTEILKAFWDKQKAEAYLTDMALAAGKRNCVLDVEDLEVQ